MGLFLGNGTCPVCNEHFQRRHEKHQFCSRKCFSKFYYHKEYRNRFPIYNCGRCGTVVKLNFSPLKTPQKWRVFKCPICNFSPTRNDLDDYQPLSHIMTITVHRKTITLTD